jgi:KH domain
MMHCSLSQPPDAAPGSSVPLGAVPGGPPMGAMSPGSMPPGNGMPPSGGMKRSFEETGNEAITPEPKRQEGVRGPPETVLRLLVPVRRVGAIIGKHGVVIKEVELSCSNAPQLCTFCARHLSGSLAQVCPGRAETRCCWLQIKEATGCRMRIIEAVPGADERVVVISSPDDPSQDRIAAEVRCDSGGWRAA